jgi:hypothetical protein|tara:strand:+ start:926 stop:1486 length:561 start_codon:yes stop_codon:yes gene_type:complete
MSRYAAAKHAKGISDRSGRAYPIRRMLLEWNGMLVGSDEYESKQPQLEPKRVRSDPQALRVSRPSQSEPEVAAILTLNPFQSGSIGSAVITVMEPGHGKSTGDTVRFRTVEAFDGFTEAVLELSSGYSITVPTNDDGDPEPDLYTFSASSGTATVGNLNGGGGSASAGPVTLPALPVVDLGNGYIT